MNKKLQSLKLHKYLVNYVLNSFKLYIWVQDLDSSIKNPYSFKFRSYLYSYFWF